MIHDPQAREAVLFLAEQMDTQAGQRTGSVARVRAILADAQPQTPESDWRSRCHVEKCADGYWNVDSPSRSHYLSSGGWGEYYGPRVDAPATSATAWGESDARAALAKAPPPPDVDQPKSPTSPHPSTTTLSTRGTGEPEKPKPETIDLKRRPWPVVIGGALASVRVIIDDGSPCGEAIDYLQEAEGKLVQALCYTRDPKSHTAPPVASPPQPPSERGEDIVDRLLSMRACSLNSKHCVVCERWQDEAADEITRLRQALAARPGFTVEQVREAILGGVWSQSVADDVIRRLTETKP